MYYATYNFFFNYITILYFVLSRSPYISSDVCDVLILNRVSAMLAAILSYVHFLSIFTINNKLQVVNSGDMVQLVITTAKEDLTVN